MNSNPMNTARHIAECASDHHAAQTDDPNAWGVTIDGAVVYEFDFTEQEARIIADLLNENPDLTWDEMEPLLEERLRQKRMEEEDAINRPAEEWLRQASRGINDIDSGAQWFGIGSALIAIAQELRQANQKPSVLLIPTETQTSIYETSIYDPQTGIQYTLTVDAGPDLSKFLSPVTFRILNAAATSDSEYPNIFIKGEEALEWWRQIVAHYRSQNRIAKFQYNQAVTAEKKAGDILRQWTMDKEDRESVPSPDPSAIPF